MKSNEYYNITSSELISKSQAVLLLSSCLEYVAGELMFAENPSPAPMNKPVCCLCRASHKSESCREAVVPNDCTWTTIDTPNRYVRLGTAWRPLKRSHWVQCAHMPSIGMRQRKQSIWNSMSSLCKVFYNRCVGFWFRASIGYMYTFGWRVTLDTIRRRGCGSCRGSSSDSKDSDRTNCGRLQPLLSGRSAQCYPIIKSTLLKVTTSKSRDITTLEVSRVPYLVLSTQFALLVYGSSLS